MAGARADSPVMPRVPARMDDAAGGALPRHPDHRERLARRALGRPSPQGATRITMPRYGRPVPTPS